MNVLDLKRDRARIAEEARDEYNAALSKDGGPTGEDRQKFDRAMSRVDELFEDIQRLEKGNRLVTQLDDPEERYGDPVMTPDVRGGDTKAQALKYRASAEYQGVFRDWLYTGEMRRDRIPAEFRDTILGTDTKGGFLVTPVQLANEIIKSIDDITYILGICTRVPLTEAKSLGVPQITTRMSDANWTTEVAAVTEDTAMVTARRDLTPAMLTKLSKVSLRMISAMAGVEDFLRMELAYRFAITLEKGFLSGNGTAPNPLGVFTASANGIPTGRDVSTSNTTTAITADNLFNVKYSIKAPYLSDPSCRWIFHRDAVRNIALLKDTTNQYLWQPGLAAGQPDRLLGIQVNQSEYAPNTFTTGLYVGILGAFRYYWTAFVGTAAGPQPTIQRLVERYADTNEIGFIGRLMIDGSPVLGEAFARVKLA
jgi:HK97 family phage major capsid protein